MKTLNKKKIKISAVLEIESMADITPEAITTCLKGMDCWMDVHNVKGRIYTTTLVNPKVVE